MSLTRRFCYSGHPRLVLRSSRCPRKGFCAARILFVLPERTPSTSTCILALLNAEETYVSLSTRLSLAAQKSFPALELISSLVEPVSRFTSAEFPARNYYREKINIDSDLCIFLIFALIFPRIQTSTLLFSC